VVWTRPAEIDLEQMGDYIAADNPDRAASFVRGIIETGEALADMLRAFPLVPRLEHRGVRQRGYGRYLILDRVTREAVEILHVAHGARDYVRALFGDVT
jgi:plasmid stabilization system protein ParE